MGSCECFIHDETQSWKRVKLVRFIRYYSHIFEHRTSINNNSQKSTNAFICKYNFICNVNALNNNRFPRITFYNVHFKLFKHKSIWKVFPWLILNTPTYTTMSTFAFLVTVLRSGKRYYKDLHSVKIVTKFLIFLPIHITLSTTKHLTQIFILEHRYFGPITAVQIVLVIKAQSLRYPGVSQH